MLHSKQYDNAFLGGGDAKAARDKANKKEPLVQTENGSDQNKTILSE